MTGLDIPNGSPFDSDGDLECPWYKQFVASRDLYQQEFPEGYNIVAVGRHAWAGLADEHKPSTMDIFFQDYWMNLRDEENEDRLAADVAEQKSYLDAADVSILWDSICDSNKDQEEVPTYRQSLLNVLCELELLQYRIACQERGDAMDAPETNDSGEAS